MKIKFFRDYQSYRAGESYEICDEVAKDFLAAAPCYRDEPLEITNPATFAAMMQEI